MKGIGANIVGGLAAMVVGAVAGGIWDAYLRPLYQQAPETFVLYSAAVLVCGVLVGGLIGWNARGMRQAAASRPRKPSRKELEAAKAAEEREAAEDRKRRLAGSLESFKGEPCGEKKAMAAVIYELPGHKAAVSSGGMSYLRYLESNRDRSSNWLEFFAFDDRGDHVVVELVPWLEELFDEHPEQLEGFTVDMKGGASARLGSFDPF